jgi:hypothetical protein
MFFRVFLRFLLLVVSLQTSNFNIQISCKEFHSGNFQLCWRLIEFKRLLLVFGRKASVTFTNISQREKWRHRDDLWVFFVVCDWWSRGFSLGRGENVCLGVTGIDWNLTDDTLFSSWILKLIVLVFLGRMEGFKDFLEAFDWLKLFETIENDLRIWTRKTIYNLWRTLRGRFSELATKQLNWIYNHLYRKSVQSQTSVVLKHPPSIKCAARVSKLKQTNAPQKPKVHAPLDLHLIILMFLY